MSRDRKNPTLGEGLPPHLAKFIDPKTGDWTPDAKKRLGKDGVERLRTTKSKSTDKTPKGYGPVDEDDSGSWTHGVTHFLMVPSNRGAENTWSIMDYKGTSGGNPLHLRKNLEQHAQSLGWEQYDVVASWAGDIDQNIETAKQTAAKYKDKRKSWPAQYWDNVETAKKLSQAKKIMANGTQAETAVDESSDLDDVVDQFIGKKNSGTRVTRESDANPRLPRQPAPVAEAVPNYGKTIVVTRAGKRVESLSIPAGARAHHINQQLARVASRLNLSEYARIEISRDLAAGRPVRKGDVAFHVVENKPREISEISSRVGSAAERAAFGKATKLSDGQAGIKEDDDPCWDGYKQLGTKKKDGKKVPDCVPEGVSYKPGVTVLTRAISFNDYEGHDGERDYRTVKKIKWPYGVEVKFDDTNRTVTFRTAKMKTVAKLLDKHIDFGSVSAGEVLELPSELMHDVTPTNRRRRDNQIYNDPRGIDAHWDDVRSGKVTEEEAEVGDKVKYRNIKSKRNKTGTVRKVDYKNGQKRYELDGGKTVYDSDLEDE